ncbi:hypothetical protein [Pseudomonas phage D6]|nr:hypothetical protein [Pseudomonas phage D6]
MSRSKTGGKGCGWEYWSRRPMRFWSPSKWAKQKCHRIERMQEKQQIYKEMQALERSA